jgi:hypothetical protein
LAHYCLVVLLEGQHPARQQMPERILLYIRGFVPGAHHRLDLPNTIEIVVHRFRVQLILRFQEDSLPVQVRVQEEIVLCVDEVDQLVGGDL